MILMAQGLTRFVTSGFLFFLMSGTALCVEPTADVRGTDHSENYLTWLMVNRSQETGLPFSHVGDERFQHWTITYDAAVVALAYSASGKYAEAGKILDYYIETPEVWRLGGIIECYIAGKPFSGKDWSVRSGANIWMGIAGFDLYLKTGDKKYLEFAEKIADFALSLQDTDKQSGNFGGVAVGPKGDAAYPADQYIGYDIEKPEFYQVYATEVTIDAYALFHKLFQSAGKEKYQLAAADCLHWLKSGAWNKSEHRFNRGHQDETVATDVQSWGVSALGVEGLDYIEPGVAEKVIEFVEKNCFSESSFTVPGKGSAIIRGVDFTDKKRMAELKRPQMISFEWTFQLINAYSRLASDYRRLGEAKKAEIYQQKKEKLLGQLLAGAISDSGGLAFPYATLSDAEIGHENRTPAAGNLSAIGGAWAVLAIKGCDPLAAYSSIDSAGVKSGCSLRIPATLTTHSGKV